MAWADRDTEWQVPWTVCWTRLPVPFSTPFSAASGLPGRPYRTVVIREFAAHVSTKQQQQQNRRIHAECMSCVKFVFFISANGSLQYH